MAGLEVVVRPFVFPDIRPRAKQSLPPQDDPEKGFAKIDGQPAQQVSLSHSMSVSSSHNRPVEVSRRVDEARVYQEEDDGTLNRDNFVDMKVANKITMREEGDRVPTAKEAWLEGLPRPTGLNFEKPNFYKRVEETNNVEVKRRDIIEKNPDAPGAGI